MPNAFVALRFDKGPQQHWRVAVTLQPILRQLTYHAREDFRGQAFELRPGQNRQACIVDHQLQISRPVRFAPAYKALTLASPSTSSKTDGRKLGTQHRCVAQIELPRDIFAPLARLGRTLNQTQRQVARLMDRLPNRSFGVARAGGWEVRSPQRTARRREGGSTIKPSLASRHQRYPARHILERPIGLSLRARSAIHHFRASWLPGRARHNRPAFIATRRHFYSGS